MTELNELKYEKLELAPAREAPRTKGLSAARSDPTWSRALDQFYRGK